MMALVLASKSPRRRALLGMLTGDFVTAEAGVKETAVQAETPLLLAKALAKEKAHAVFAERPNDVVLGCDTVVELDGRTLGKPKDQQEAMEMLGALSGRRHLVHTGVCIFVPGSAQAAALFAQSTGVDFAQIPQQEMWDYTATPEPYDKAGGYGIQGAVAKYIPRIEGCYYNVMGLPLAALYAEMRRLGLL